MEVAPAQEVAPNGHVEEGLGERSESVAVAESRGTRSVTNMLKDADMLDVDLEEEFRKLCGHPEPEILQVCNRLEMAIKDMEVLVLAEVAKVIRIGNPSRAAVEQETVRCQRSELEELRKAKRQLEQQELELQQLRAETDLQQAPRIVGTEAKNSDEGVSGEPPRRVTSDGAAGWAASDPAGPWSRTEDISGEDATYSFNAFLENFLLKYPKCGSGEAELGVLLRSKLVGKAKTQYEALPRAIREGSFEEQVDALRQACTAE
ncbi:unnamed protein product [Heligmosomoides polygyrus]|uniref:Retrotrans_gag domain-containing protein n=1 Tax=Heligmosomoides polygyrus TaxID=6339 RepID=A0A183FWE5_HELPZ|nr:unnamed protein product [Heligmosomoides polygyrus]